MHALLRSAAIALALAPSVLLTGCMNLDGKAQRSFTGSDAKPTKLVIESRFLDVDLSVATADSVSVDALIVLQTSGGNETAEREIEKCTVHLDREGDTLYVRQGVKGENIGVWNWSGSGTLKIALPAGVPFLIDSASGDVHMTGNYGDVAAAVSVASGDVNADVAVTSFSLDSASGDGKLVFRAPLAALRCETASGDLTILAPSIAKSDVDAASGDIVIKGMAGPFKIATASGDVQLQFVDFPAIAAGAVSTASGDIAILLPAGAEPSGSIETASGSITLGVPGKETRGSATLSGSGAKIAASAASGDVRITTAPKAK